MATNCPCFWDLRFLWEKSKMYFPTSHFAAAVHTILAVAVQENMGVFDWGIQGSFCTAEADMGNLMLPPQKYSLPPTNPYG
jgi:hypothetical protein